MYISRIKVENIRGFSGPRNVDLALTRPDGSHAGWTVIAGRNGSGKTSLLRAIALAVNGPSVARNLLPDFQNWIAVGEDSGSTEVERRTSLSKRPMGALCCMRPTIISAERIDDLMGDG